MEADHIGHPDQKDSDVQADPQNERNTAEQARPADPFGQAVSMCERPLGAIRIRAVVRRARALPGADAAAEQRRPGKLSGGVMGGGAGVNRLSGSVLKQVETGLSRLSGGVKRKAAGRCVGILS